MSGVSFGFTKKKEQKVLQTSVIADTERKESDDKNFLTNFDENTAKQAEKKELVIPLIQNNLWRNTKPPNTKRPNEDNEHDESKEESVKKKQKTEKATAPETKLEGEDAAAAQELMQEALMLNDDWDTRNDVKLPDMTIPILMRNKVPEGFESDDKLDVSLRPDGANDANYDEVPIEAFGKAMLRGMGWMEGKGIGKNGEVVAPINAVLRPKGMGLGADRSLVEQLKSKKGAKSSGKEEEKLEMKSGTHCVVTSGKHENYYGQIQGLDEDNSRAFVKLTITGEKISVNQFKLRLVTDNHKKNSKYINKGKADEYHKETEKKLMEKYETEQSGRKHKHKQRDHDRHTDRHSDRKSRRDDDRSDNDDDDKDSDKRSSKQSSKHKDSKHSKYDRESNGAHSKSSSASSRSRVWVRPNLRVRIINNKFKKGKYYKEKVIIEDVISGQECICKTDDGKLLEGLNQDMLETVIPKSVPGIVMVVSGPHSNKLCDLIEKDKTNYIATVQVLPDRDEVLQIDFDSICDYTGDTQTELNY